MRKLLLVGSAVGLALIAALWLASVAGHRSDDDQPPAQRAALIKAFKSFSLTDARLVGFTKPGPPAARPVACCRDIARRVRNLAVAASNDARQAEALSTLALIDLLAEQPEKSRRHLQNAIRLRPRDPKAQTDLAAVCLDLARLKKNSSYVIDAFAAADVAVQLAPDLPEARFNFALAAERLFLRAPALRAWRWYLETDEESAWVYSARRHWFELSRPTPQDQWELQHPLLLEAAAVTDQVGVRRLVVNFTQRSRQYASETLLAEWGRAHLMGHGAAADRAMAAARSIGDTLAARPGGDSMVKDSVVAVARNSPALRNSLASAHLLYAAGLVAYASGDVVSARASFRASLRKFEMASSPMWMWASFDLARCDYLTASYQSSLARLISLKRETDLARYPALTARIDWTTGLLLVIQGRFTHALQAYSSALKHARRAQEIEMAASIHVLLAENYRLLGETERSWHHLYAALRSLSAVHEPQRAQAVLDEATLHVLDRKMPRLALLFQTEALNIARASGNAVPIAVAYNRRAGIHEQLGKLSAALRDLRRSRQAMMRIEDGALRASMSADLLRSTARIYSRSDPLQAIKLLSNALAQYGNTDYKLAVPGLLVERARAHSRLGDDQLAADDLERSILYIEEMRASTPPGNLRVTYLDQEQAAFNEMVLLQARRGADAAALGYSERARARVLLELTESATANRVARPGAVTLTAEEIQRRIPAEVTLVVYSAYDDVLLAWVVSRQLVRLHTMPLRRGELTDAVALLRREIWTASPAAIPTSERLYRSLIQPLAPSLEPGAVLVFVPDTTLSGVPFAVLRNSATGRYLIEDHALLASPSASIFVHCVERLRALPQHNRSALIVGDPAFEATEWPWLNRLTYAGQEARRLAALLPNSTLLIGPDATVRSVGAAARHARYVHLGVHAILDLKSPLLSGLVLGPDEQNGGLLTASDLYRMRFDATELVCIASCHSAGGAPSAREGVMNLVRPFIAAGVPSVIVSLWPLSDSATSPLMYDVYRYLQRDEGSSVVAALRLAQLDALQRSKRDPAALRDWGGLAIIGASR